MIGVHNLLLSIQDLAEALFKGRLNNHQLVDAMHRQRLEKAEERVGLS